MDAQKNQERCTPVTRLYRMFLLYAEHSYKTGPRLQSMENSQYLQALDIKT